MPETYATSKIDKSIFSRSPSDNYSPIDFEKGIFDLELIESWNRLIYFCAPLNRQIYLNKDNYRPFFRALNKIWLDAFVELQAKFNRPLLCLDVTPFGKKGIFSLRYDVDRPITKTHIDHIIQIQSKLINSPCATWFLFRDDYDSGKYQQYLDRHLQERAVHLVREEDAIAGAGSSYHSSPYSNYWTGNAGLGKLQKIGVGFSEFLFARLPFPHPIPVDGSGDHIWATPIHFPLEGSVHDTDLHYFDNLKPEFQEALDYGEHIIIGSHPDVDQKILEDLLNRFSISNMWCVTISAAVERSRIISEDVIFCGYQGDDAILYSRRGVSDLKVSLMYPNKDNEKVRLNLVPGTKRCLAV